ncbi:MAG: PPOX class F420-dependent oxidoreductase [Chloroflexota bacterium]|nr:PPOX class F420-dependent oxidoreductase [Chloroflexota bacterium]
MTDDEREAFLRQANVAVLGTVDARGRPHAAPVWYLYDDGVVRISTGYGSQKHRNILANPNISLVIDQRALPYYAVMVQGTADIGPAFSDEDSLRLAVRYLGENLGARYAERTDAEASVSLAIRPRKVIVYDPMPGFRRR